MADAYPVPPESPPGRPGADDWRRRQREAASRRPPLALQRGDLFIGFAPLGYRVFVEGRELRPAIAPPRATVAGITVTHLQFTPDGGTLRGRLSRRPPDAHFVIDYGFARAEADLSSRVSWWHWPRPLLLQVWTWLDRLIRRGLSLLP